MNKCCKVIFAGQNEDGVVDYQLKEEVPFCIVSHSILESAYSRLKKIGLKVEEYHDGSVCCRGVFTTVESYLVNGTFIKATKIGDNSYPYVVAFTSSDESDLEKTAKQVNLPYDRQIIKAYSKSSQ